MKSHLFHIGLGLCMLMAVTCHAAVEMDLLKGGDFESGGWSIATWSGDGQGAIADQVSHGGAKSLHMQGKADATIVAQRNFRLIAGSQPVALSGYWKGSVTKGTGGRIVIRWLDADGKSVADAAPVTKSGTFDWAKFETTFKPPPGAAQATIFLEIWETTGEVWYDDVRVALTFEPVMPGEVRTARHPGDPRVAVFDANRRGGTGYGAVGIQHALFKRHGLEADLIEDLSLATLVNYDALVLPNVHVLPGAEFAEVLAGRPAIAWTIDARAAVSAYVRMGGGLILTHQSCGQSAFKDPLTPSIASVIDKTFDTVPTWFADDPVTRGLQPFEPSFEDSRVLQLGPAGQVVMKNKSGHALAVVGGFGGGKVVAIGLCPGIDKDLNTVLPTGGEEQLLFNAAKWAAATQVQPVIVLVSPNLITITEPKQPLEFTVVLLPTSKTVAGEPKLDIALVGDKHRLQPAQISSIEDTGGITMLRVGFATDKLEEAEYRIEVKNSMATYEEPDNAGMVKNQAAFAKFADSLPKAQFEWSAMNVHGPTGLKTEEEFAEMAKMAKEMNFKAVLYNAKPPSGYVYYNTKIGEEDPAFQDIDPLALAVKHCHAQGLQLLVQFCAFAEGGGKHPSKFMREHPDYADWNPGDGPDLSKQQHGVFGCPDRPEVRAYELSLIREMAENYDIDGISFDYIRYKDDRYCVCPYSEAKFAEYRKAHPDLAEAAARAHMAEEAIVSFTWEVRKLLDDVRPGLLLHGYCHPTWANKFPLKYLSFRASAHGDDPARGGEWPLEQVYEAAKRNVELADDHVDYMRAAPMADTAYLNWAKSPDRFRRELRLISHAGARDIMVYLYSTLRHKPELREAISKELAD